MYSNKNIPAPFAQPRQGGGQKERTAPKKEAPKDDAVPIIAKEKTVKKKAASPNTSPLLAVLLFDLFSNKEG